VISGDWLNLSKMLLTIL